ncbi:hypothetical protein [Novosphingobium sp. NDB2Meth1]|uniref:hypothetical protein n=1 Tax=Novosphingobium sp. NDB2Meth1 TaxID=1892847 RepID=UPI000A53CD88|nr:hypothetical protein [Novosphingobium sp. NDB2Meth1]
MSAPEDIDPKAVNVAERKQRRKRRAAPKPSPQLLAGKERALKRAKARPLTPGVMLEPQAQGYQVTAPHSDLELWELQVADAFGTRSQSVMQTFLDQLRVLVPLAWDKDAEQWKPNETELNAALAMVADVQPRNVREAALAAQMVAVHWMQMRLSAAALNNGHMVLDRDAALASKLARTFTMQLDSLARIRGRRQTARQSIKVRKELHQHVHYHDYRGAGKTGEQAHDADARPTAQCSALPSSEPGGQILRLPSRKRQAGV